MLCSANTPNVPAPQEAYEVSDRERAIERFLRSIKDLPFLKALETIFAVHTLGGLDHEEALLCISVLMGDDE